MQSTLTKACKEVFHVYSFVHQSINTFSCFSFSTHQNAARQQQQWQKNFQFQKRQKSNFH